MKEDNDVINSISIYLNYQLESIIKNCTFTVATIIKYTLLKIKYRKICEISSWRKLHNFIGRHNFDFPKPTECKILRVNPKVSYSFYMIMMCQCKFESMYLWYNNDNKWINKLIKKYHSGEW